MSHFNVNTYTLFCVCKKKKKKAGESASPIYERGRVAHRKFSWFSRWPLRAWASPWSNRKQFAENMQTKDMDYWNHVLWSDETKINLFGSDGVKHVSRQPGEEYKDKCVLPTVKHGGWSVVVWGCMSAAGSGEPQLIEGTMNANM